MAIPKSKIAEYVDRLQGEVIPTYETAPGLESVRLLRRSLVGYDELTAISVWRSEEALKCFLESASFSGPLPESSGIASEPRTYDLLCFRKGRRINRKPSL